MKCKIQFKSLIIAIIASALALSGCEGDDGAPGVDGTNGDPGLPGSPGVNTGFVPVGVTTFHGTEYLESSGEFALATNPKRYVTATITSATADTGGTVTVNFSVEDGNGDPDATVSSISANIVKLIPAAAPESYNKWVPYIQSAQTVSNSATGDWPNPDGTSNNQGSRESNGTLTNNNDGTYTYVFNTVLGTTTLPVEGTAIAYERNRTHRVSIMMGGHSGSTADANFDFVPDGSAGSGTRNIVTTEACKGCHSTEFHGHGGDRLTVENCVTCHNPSTTDPHGGETVDFKVMIHKIHAGGELASIPGADGIVWDDPATGTDESADNGEYAIWGYREIKHEWWKVEFPAVIENCTKCHQETGGATLTDVDNWKTVPSRAACGSCHDDVDFATGTNHGGGTYPAPGPINDDTFCVTCHEADTDSGFAPSIVDAHDWTTKDQRHIAEFDVDLTVSAPANGMYFVAGESPVVRVVLTDVNDPTNPGDDILVTHDTITTEVGGAEGCLPTACPARDNAFGASGLYVHGPRARRVPVLTTNARVEVISPSAGPFDLSAITEDLIVTFDNGKDLYSAASGLSSIGSATVSVDLTACNPAYIASLAAATANEIMACLNADTDFAARGIAYIDETTSRLAIRSRNLADFYAVQLTASDANTAIFNNTTLNVMGGFTVSATLAGSDPKITRTPGYIEYALDPVDDLQAGTYMVGVEIADRGRVTTSDYKTPSVKKAYFQVKQAEEEKAIANNCDSCHQGPEGTGFVLDFYRHNKIFDHTAVDQCGQCHDYQSASASGDAGTSDGWNGSRPINRRVHAIHYGSSLNYPLLTVNYGNDDPVAGRNWDITFPQDVRNCEVCHSATDTSGTWKTNAGRSPCSGCHDSNAATAHLKLMTYDPTPSDPWSGDEEESCKVCH